MSNDLPELPPEAFAKEDPAPDPLFYATPRFVTHIDDPAIAAVTQLYRTLFPPGGTILDLMGSWVAHLPPEIAYAAVIGHGMNEAEVEANPRYTRRFVQDLNADPVLSLADRSVDAAALCVSVQYLQHPVAVFREVRRVLKPGGVIAITFSNRCFPTKAVAIWLGLPMGQHQRLVALYLQRAGFAPVEPRVLIPPGLDHDPLWAVIGFAPEDAADLDSSDGAFAVTDVVSLPKAGYAFLKGQGNPFSGGIACLKGYALTRVRFRTPLPLAEGFAKAASIIRAEGRPLAALAACELRSPAQMSPSDFAAFNRHYVELLRANGFPAEAPLPMARSNVASSVAPPSTNTLFAFTYAVPAAAADGPAQDFLISGRAEMTDEPRSVVADGDVSAAGTEKKAAHVFAQLRARVDALGCGWSDITCMQIYTTRSLDPVMPLIGRLGLGDVGLCLYPAQPPVVSLEFEVDVRSVSVERRV